MTPHSITNLEIRGVDRTFLEGDQISSKILAIMVGWYILVYFGPFSIRFYLLQHAILAAELFYIT